jgi:hypothetical protein
VFSTFTDPNFLAAFKGETKQLREKEEGDLTEEEENYTFYLGLLEFVSKLSAGRHRASTDYFLDSKVAWIEEAAGSGKEPMFSYARLTSGLGNDTLPWAVREIFLQLLMNLHVDREPFDTFDCPHSPGAFKRPYSCSPLLIVNPVSMMLLYG